MGLNKPITHINPLDPNGVAVCPSGFDCVRYAHSAQDDNQAFVLCTWYNGNNGRFVNRPYETTKVGGSIGDGGSKPPPYKTTKASGNVHDVGEQAHALRKDRTIWSYYETGYA